MIQKLALVVKSIIRLAEPPPGQDYRGTLTIENLRMSFSVYKSLSLSANTAYVRIYNLSADNRNQLNQYGNELNFYAGYRENGGSQLLFTGNTTLVNHVFEYPEIISVFDLLS